MTRGPSTVVYATSEFAMLVALSACGQMKPEIKLTTAGLVPNSIKNSDKSKKH